MRTWTHNFKRIGLASTVAVAGALTVPSAALAAPAIVSFQAGAFSVRAAPATEDSITITTAGTFLRTAAPVSKVAPVAPCIGGPNAVFCPGANTVTSILVGLGDQDDTVTLTAPLSPVPTTVNLGRGDDRATGGPGPERITGGRGADSVRGGAGDDTLNMKGGGKDIRIDCGPGDDTATVDSSDAKPKNCETIRR